jgi:hypothetical protein
MRRQVVTLKFWMTRKHISLNIKFFYNQISFTTKNIYFFRDSASTYKIENVFDFCFT